ncbi:MAG: GNAT family protein [Candidatus Altiarchaeota archaeon]
MNIRFRRVRESDLRRLNEIVNDMEVSHYLGLLPPVTMKSTREFYTQCMSKKHLWYGIIVDGSIAGSVFLGPGPERSKISHSAEFGISIAREYWGRGVGDKAIMFMIRKARELGLKRIELGVVEGNRRARSLYMKHGFVKEGLKRKAFMIKGRYHNMIVMARLM